MESAQLRNPAKSNEDSNRSKQLRQSDVGGELSRYAKDLLRGHYAADDIRMLDLVEQRYSKQTIYAAGAFRPTKAPSTSSAGDMRLVQSSIASGTACRDPPTPGCATDRKAER